jgi:hypothetical protein
VPDGEKAHTCISNGILLGLGGLILSGGSVTNLPLIIGDWLRWRCELG